MFLNNFYKEYFATYKTDLHRVWKGINEIINTKSNTNSSPNLIIHNKKEINNPENIAGIFNNFYGNIAKETKNEIPKSKKNFTEFLKHPNRNSIFFTPTTPIEIYKLIQNMDDTKASGPNSISTRVLKIIAPSASDILSNIINECLDIGSYPPCLKKASIKPLHKKGSRLDVGNYRPISLLSNINKIFEKLLLSRIINFFNQNKILYEKQFGFRKGHNTKHAITALTELIRESLDNNGFAAGIFIDLKKAFDTVEHSILIHKLRHYGIRGKALDTLRSYLSNRSHCVEIQDVKSDYVIVEHGVPQGSVLGPLLFIIYINDLHNCIENSETIHFADDTSLLCRETSLKKLTKKINRDLSLIVDWLRANKISLNTSKTELVLFKNPTKQITKHLNFRLSGQKIHRSSSVKYLGILIDENLSWEHHLRSLSSKLARAVGFLSKLRHCLNYKTLLSVYYALFDSHINYCIQCLGHVNITSLEKIEKLQNKAMRIIHFKTQRDSVKPLYIRSRILPIRKQLQMINCLFAFDFINDNTPPYFNDFFRLANENRRHNTRSSSLKFEIQKTRTVRYGTYNIANSITKDWNNIHPNLSIPDLRKVSRSTFKKHLHQYIICKLAE